MQSTLISCDKKVLGGTPVFASWAMRLASRWSINIISLRPVREYAHRLRVAKSNKPAVRKKPADTVVVEAKHSDTVVVEKFASATSNLSDSNGHGVTRIDVMPPSGRETLFKK